MTANNSERERIIHEIEERVRPTICQTFSSHPDLGTRERVEGRISRDDFDALVLLAMPDRKSP